MKKLRKFFKLGGPIFLATAVLASATATFVLNSKNSTSVKSKTNADTTTNIDTNEADEQLEGDIFTRELDCDMPSVIGGKDQKDDWGRIALVPKYDEEVIDKFGAVYEPDYEGTDVPNSKKVVWPRLIAKDETRKNGDIPPESLLTFEELIPNKTLAELFCNIALNVHPYETILYWNGTNWINRLAEERSSTPDKRQWLETLNARNLFLYATQTDKDSSSTSESVEELFTAVFMNPFAFDMSQYSDNFADATSQGGYDCTNKENYPSPAYSHIYLWDLSNNLCMSLPRGFFKYLDLGDTEYWKNKTLQIIMESNNFCVFNPLQAFGDRRVVEGHTETWADRKEWAPYEQDKDANDHFSCPIQFNIAQNFINPKQVTWTGYGGQVTRYDEKEILQGPGWNIPRDTEDKLLYKFETWSLKNDGKQGWSEVYDGVPLEKPAVGPVMRSGTTIDDPGNYGLATEGDDEKLSNIVMEELTNGWKDTHIWASNEVDEIVNDSLDCINYLNLISLYPTSTLKFSGYGEANDLDGYCEITIRQENVQAVDVQQQIKISGFNESTSGLILSVCLTLVFFVVLYWSIHRVYRNYHPKLSKDEMKLINEINSANRLHSLRKAQEKRSKSEDENK